MGYDPKCSCADCEEQRRFMAVASKLHSNPRVRMNMGEALVRKIRRQSRLKKWTNTPDYRPKKH